MLCKNLQAHPSAQVKPDQSLETAVLLDALTSSFENPVLQNRQDEGDSTTVSDEIFDRRDFQREYSNRVGKRAGEAKVGATTFGGSLVWVDLLADPAVAMSSKWD